MAMEKTTRMHDREIKRIGPVMPFVAILTEDRGGRGANTSMEADRRSRYGPAELAACGFDIVLESV